MSRKYGQACKDLLRSQFTLLACAGSPFTSWHVQACFLIPTISLELLGRFLWVRGVAAQSEHTICKNEPSFFQATVYLKQ